MTLSLLRESISTILIEFPTISLVYLFGSQVSGQIGPMSDFDLAILDHSQGDEFAVQAHFQHAVVKLLNTERVDIILLNRAPIELMYTVISSGQLLFKKDEYTRVEFEAQVLSKYGDYLPVLRRFKQLTLQGGNHEKRVQRYREALRRTQRTLGPARTSSRSKSS